MTNRELLPIGSVIEVGNEDKKLMIFGVKQTDPGAKDPLVFDYVCVPYPEGNLGLEYQFFVNNSEISNVVFRGFENAERDTFIDELKKVI